MVLPDLPDVPEYTVHEYLGLKTVPDSLDAGFASKNQAENSLFVIRARTMDGEQQ